MLPAGGVGNDGRVNCIRITGLIAVFVLSACAYRPFAPPDAGADAATSPDRTFRAVLLDRRQWDSGGRKDLVAIHLTAENHGDVPVDLEPWDCRLSSTRMDVHPLSPLRAAVSTSARPDSRPGQDSFGIVWLALRIAMLPFDYGARKMQASANADRLDDFQQKMLAPVRLVPGSKTEGVLVYEEKMSSRMELSCILWNEDGTQGTDTQIVLRSSEP